MRPAPSTITKTYPPRGPIQQFRFADSAAFNCFRCAQSKKSKLITVYRGDWSKRLCNACYGRLLSLYEIKAGTAAEDERAEALASALTAMAAGDDVRNAEKLFRASERRAEYLSAEALRFIATAEFVAGRLEAEPQLEWSPAIIGLCKAVEVELVGRILKPLAALVSRENLAINREEKSITRVAAYCADPTRKPPELGTFAHFLQIAIDSSRGREGSTLVSAFLRLISNWPGSQWLIHPEGLHRAVTALAVKFRNPAAHIAEMGQPDYAGCRSHVIGADGALWRLVVATEARR